MLSTKAFYFAKLIQAPVTPVVLGELNGSYVVYLFNLSKSLGTPHAGADRDMHRDAFHV
jgi:hypothetical protein